VAGDNAAALEASSFLRERGFHCPAVRYPTVPRGGARLRISVCSQHTPAQLAGLRDALISWGGRR
jgi:7-keto-8-aminopelargonate synthetase-like enzyme